MLNDISSFAADLRAQNSPRLTGTVAVQSITRRPHVGASLVTVLLGLTLTACATAEGPPGKSQAQLDYENNLCSMPASHAYTATEVYAQCMLSFGNMGTSPRRAHLRASVCLRPLSTATAVHTSTITSDLFRNGGGGTGIGYAVYCIVQVIA